MKIKLLKRVDHIMITGLLSFQAKRLYEYFKERNGAEIFLKQTIEREEYDVSIFFRATEPNQKLIDCFSTAEIGEIEDTINAELSNL